MIYVPNVFAVKVMCPDVIETTRHGWLPKAASVAVGRASWIINGSKKRFRSEPDAWLKDSRMLYPSPPFFTTTGVPTHIPEQSLQTAK